MHAKHSTAATVVGSQQAQPTFSRGHGWLAQLRLRGLRVIVIGGWLGWQAAARLALVALLPPAWPPPAWPLFFGARGTACERGAFRFVAHIAARSPHYCHLALAPPRVMVQERLAAALPVRRRRWRGWVRTWLGSGSSVARHAHVVQLLRWQSCASYHRQTPPAPGGYNANWTWPTTRARRFLAPHSLSEQLSFSSGY